MIFDVTQNLEATLPTFIALIVVFTSFLVLLYERIFKGKSGELIKMLLLLIVVVIMWCYTYILVEITVDEQAYILLTKIQNIPIAFTGIIWLSLALIYTGYTKFLKRYIFLLLLPPIVVTIISWTNDYHHLFYTSLGIDGYSWGPLWWFPHAFFSYVFVITGIVLFVIKLIKSKERSDKMKALMVLLGAVLPFLGNILYILVIKNYTAFHFDPTATLFSISIVFFMYGLFKYRLFDDFSLVFDELMRNISSGIVVLDKSKKIVAINDRAISLVQSKSKHLKGRSLTQIKDSGFKKNRDKIFSLIAKIDKGEGNIKKDVFQVGKDNNIHIAVAVSPVRDRANTIFGYLVVLEDITDLIAKQKQIEEFNVALKKEKENYQKANADLSSSRLAMIDVMNEMKITSKDLGVANDKLKEVDDMRKKFVSMTAHELRSPLNLYRWTLEMLINEDAGKINENQRELINQMYQSNKRLLHIVEDLSEVSHIDQERFTVSIGTCNLVELIEQSLGEHALKVRQKNIKVSWSKPKKKLAVSADCERMAQVLNNILDNAVKYAKNGGQIDIKCIETAQIAPKNIMLKQKLKSKKTKFIKCSIKDNGIGIPKSEHGKMFNRFFRASNAVEKKIEGTGLGMTITKEIIDLHRGALWFTSSENKGTTFNFTIPITK